MQMMILIVVMMMVMLQTRHNYRHRSLDINWPRYVSGYGDVFLLHDGNVSNLLHKNGNLLLDGDLSDLAMIPIADVIR